MLVPKVEGRRRSAFTLIELLVVVAIIALLISILLPSLARAREIARRSVCAANLKGMGTSFYTYGGENSDMWPCVEHTTPTGGTIEGEGEVTYVGTTGINRSDSPADNASLLTEVSVTRNLWMLIRMDMAQPGSFVCPSTNDMPNKDPEPRVYYDFGEGDTSTVEAAYSQVSYGYQVPWGRKGRPSADLDLRMPVAADKGPYGEHYEGGGAEVIAPTLAESATPSQWMKWNSPNHGGPTQGEGQNVLLADGSASWREKPCVGAGFDNIYTRWNNAAGGGNVTGTPPSENEVPFGGTDTLIYP